MNEMELSLPVPIPSLKIPAALPHCHHLLLKKWPSSATTLWKKVMAVNTSQVVQSRMIPLWHSQKGVGWLPPSVWTTAAQFHSQLCNRNGPTPWLYSCMEAVYGGNGWITEDTAEGMVTLEIGLLFERFYAWNDYILNTLVKYGRKIIKVRGKSDEIPLESQQSLYPYFSFLSTI